jgi:hypothetical protein
MPSKFVAGAFFVSLATIPLPVFASNLVVNGSFDEPGTTIGQFPKTVNLPGWSSTCINQCQATQTQLNSFGFSFVVDDTMDNRSGGGVLSTTSAGTEQLYFWGPENTVSNSNNGFTGSPSGGKFVAIDGDFGRAKLSQVVNGLDVNKEYTLSFEYAGAQQGLNATDFSGDTVQKWLVDGIGPQITVGPWTNPSRGFTPWQSFSTVFTPSSASIDLQFTPFGNVVGGGEPTGFDSLPPFLLLDNVQIIESNGGGGGGGDPIPVPGPLPLAGAASAYSFARRIRQRLRAARI